MLRIIFVLLFSGVVYSAGVLADAPDCAKLRADLAQDPKDLQVSELFQADCLGGKFDSEPSAKEFQKMLETAAKVDGKAVADPDVPRKDVTLSPEERRTLVLRGLGIAYYRAGNWQACIETMAKAEELALPDQRREWFYLAMADWQIGQQDDARQLFRSGVDWMQQTMSGNEDLQRSRAEAAQLLGVPNSTPPDSPDQHHP